jgi:hypothetical protein
MSEQHDIYLRSFAKQLAGKERKDAGQHNSPKWPAYALAFDCESRITEEQTLTFGFWRFCELLNGAFVCTEEGIFHDEGLSTKEFGFLRRYTSTTKPETTDDGSPRLRLYSRSKFVQEVLGMAIQAKALIVCFNAPFDLSRLAADWETAANGGWSLILSQWRNPEAEELRPNKYFPRIVVKALNSKAAIIHTTRAPMSEPGKKSKKAKLWPAARFLDLRTLLWALRNRSYSLESACKEFDIPGKLDHKPTGRVDSAEVEYCRQDVRSTVALLNAAKEEYDLHPIAPGPDRMFSPASVAKSYLQELHIVYPLNVDPDKFTLITAFSSERDQWMRSKCINIYDYQSPAYELTNEYDGRRALPKNFFMLLDSYQNHPEAKSLGPGGKPCEFDTRGLLQRSHIVANWPPIYIGKESDRHWEEGEDLSLLEFKAIEYRPKGYAVAESEHLTRIAKVPKREFMRRGINQHTLEKICRREPVRAIKLAECLKVLEEYESATPN